MPHPSGHRGVAETRQLEHGHQHGQRGVLPRVPDLGEGGAREDQAANLAGLDSRQEHRDRAAHRVADHDTEPVASSDENRETVRRRSISARWIPERRESEAGEIHREDPTQAREPCATWTQFRCKPPSPCTRTKVVSEGPSHSR